MNFTRILNADWSLSYDEQARQKPGKPLKYGSELLLKYYRYDHRIFILSFIKSFILENTRTEPNMTKNY